MRRPSLFAVEKAHADVLASRAEGWPKPGSPYDKLVTAELHARRITQVGGVIGTLLEEQVVKASQLKHGFTEKQIQRNDRLHLARRVIVADRAASGALKITTLMPTDAIMPTFEAAPWLAARQLQKIIDASQSGWDVRMAAPIEFVEFMPPNAYDLHLIGDPAAPEAVYRQGLDPSIDPHEAWQTSDTELTAAAATYAHISRAALDEENTQYYMEHMHQFFSGSVVSNGK